MYYKTIGELLEYNRKKNNISQSLLCKGICSNATYYRYEQDLTIPSKYTLNYLLERLGLNPNTINYLCTKSDVIALSLQNSINNSIDNSSYAYELIEKYQKNRSLKNINLHQQYILKMKGVLAEKQCQTIAAINYYREALCCTKKSTQIDLDSLYSVTEFFLILRLILIRNDYESLFKIYEFILSLPDIHILKITYKGEIVEELTKSSTISDEFKIQAINSVISYKKRIHQLNNIDVLINRKSMFLSLEENEKELLNYTDIIQELKDLLRNDRLQ